jgi:hypothetical protein
MFAGKKPIEAKADNAAPVAPTGTEPEIPLVPAMVLAAYRQNTPAGEDRNGFLPGTSLLNCPAGPVHPARHNQSFAEPFRSP